jgi:hypothetical protein
MQQQDQTRLQRRAQIDEDSDQSGSYRGGMMGGRMMNRGMMGPGAIGGGMMGRGMMAGECEVVEGRIRPMGWCDLYAPRRG